jgi:hypothetical protein
MYPEKLTFDGERLRTTRINEAAQIIYKLGKAFSENEKGQSGNIPTLSSQVGKTGRTQVRLTNYIPLNCGRRQFEFTA